MKFKPALIRRSINAILNERYIFNFRLKPEDLQKHIPVKWLKPQVFNGWSIVSFCILDIDKITVAPIPNIFNFETISCAYRVGVTDISGDSPAPSVYITDRNSDLPIIAKLGPFLLADAIPMVKTSIGHDSELVRIQANYADGQNLFSAEAKPADFKSEMFETLDDFKAFILNGVSSYTPSIYPDYYTRVDLHKSDTVYDAFAGEVEYSWLDGPWKDAGLVLDSGDSYNSFLLF
jgi:hypothetical protein